MTEFNANLSVAQCRQLFHKLWTRDALTADYCKKDWLELEAVIERFFKKYPEQSIACVFCFSTSVMKIYRPEVYEFGYVCRSCDRGFNA